MPALIYHKLQMTSINFINIPQTGLEKFSIGPPSAPPDDPNQPTKKQEKNRNG